MLSVKEVTVAYDGVLALQGVSFAVRRREIVSIVGSNGAGKSTILKTVSGLLPLISGPIEFEGMRIDGAPPHEIVRRRE